MAAGVRIRDAESTDAAAIAGIGREALVAEYAALVDHPEAVRAAVEQIYSVEAVEDSIARCQAADVAEFLVAERDGSVEGYLHFDSFGPEPELHRHYVAAPARGNGLGGRLIDALEGRLPASLHYLLLAQESNVRAVAFYERHGLEVTEHVDGLAYYRDRLGIDLPESAHPFRLVLMRQAPRQRGDGS